MLIGKDPRLVDSINDRMDAALVGHSCAKVAIDVACWDLLGTATGTRVCELLGRDTGERMPLVSSILSSDQDDMRERVADHRERGYRGHSVKVGTLDEYFIVDANGGMTVELALRFLKLVPDELDFVFEAPCATWQERLRLQQLTDRPLVLDEFADSDVAAMQAVASGAADAFSLKVSKNGGLTQCRRQRDIALALPVATKTRWRLPLTRLRQVSPLRYGCPTAIGILRRWAKNTSTKITNIWG